MNTGRWLIWSQSHEAWWMPAEQGYTMSRNEAGRYSFDRALEITMAANEYPQPPDRVGPMEAMVPEDE